MLRRASELTARARERIRAAREHDPHGWPERDDDRAILVHDDEPIDFVQVPDEPEPQDDDAGSTRPPLGSPEPGAPDVDGVVGPAGVSGPPQGGRPHRPAERSRRLITGADRRSAAEDGVPNGLRTAAAWSWRLIVVIAGFYVLLYAAAYVAVVVVPVIVALLLAALLQPGAAWLVRRGWPRSLAAFTMLVVGLGVVAGIITLVVERFTAGFTDLAAQVSKGLGRGGDLRGPHAADHEEPARGRASPSSRRPCSTTRTASPRAPSPPRRPSARCSPASSSRCSRCSSSSRTAARSGCGWSACSPATPAPTSTRPAAGRGAR